MKGPETLFALLSLHTFHLPQPDDSIISATGNSLPIRAKDDRPHATRVPLKDFEAVAAVHVPDPKHPMIVSMHEQVSIRTDGHSPDDLTESFHRSHASSVLP